MSILEAILTIKFVNVHVKCLEQSQAHGKHYHVNCGYYLSEPAV